METFVTLSPKMPLALALLASAAIAAPAIASSHGVTARTAQPAAATSPTAQATTTRDTVVLNVTPAANARVAPITKEEVLAAQRAWGEALVRISTTNERQGRDAAKRVAEQVLDGAYGYNLGPVLFKPTLTVAPQTFRTTRDGALAYFVGGNPAFPADKGFALGGWRSYEVENAAIFLNGPTAVSMGNVRLTNAKGEVTTVDKTWGWTRDRDGRLRIVLHHSSLPFTAS